MEEVNEDRNPELPTSGSQVAVKTENIELVTEEIKVEEFDIPLFDAEEGEGSSVPIKNKKEQTIFVDADDLKSEEKEVTETDSLEEKFVIEKVSEDGKLVHKCPNCEYTSTKLDNVKRHITVVHAHVLFHCDKCDFSCRQVDNLKTHEKIKHQGFRFKCDQCESSFTTNHSLKMHQNAIHKGIFFQCDKCEFKTGSKS